VDEQLTGDASQRLVREHAALGRAATLVARQPSTAEVFAVVKREAGMLLGARMTGLLRVESPVTAVFAASWSSEGGSLAVEFAGCSTAADSWGRPRASGPGQARGLRRSGWGGRGADAPSRSPVRGSRPDRARRPDRGVLSATWAEGMPIPVGAENRVAEFAELCPTRRQGNGGGNAPPEFARLAHGMHPAFLSNRGLAAAV
jgi:hypothetical protein